MTQLNRYHFSTGIASPHFHCSTLCTGHTESYSYLSPVQISNPQIACRSHPIPPTERITARPHPRNASQHPHHKRITARPHPRRSILDIILISQIDTRHNLNLDRDDHVSWPLPLWQLASENRTVCPMEKSKLDICAPLQ